MRYAFLVFLTALMMAMTGCGRVNSRNTDHTVWVSDAEYYTCTGGLTISYQGADQCVCSGGNGYQESCFVVHPTQN